MPARSFLKLMLSRMSIGCISRLGIRRPSVELTAPCPGVGSLRTECSDVIRLRAKCPG